MTTFDGRKHAHEAELPRSDEMAFRITARRNRLLGRWAAEKMALTPEETDAYATTVVQADFEQADDEDIVRKLFGDMTAAGVDIDDTVVRRALVDTATEARRQLMQVEQ